MTDEERIALRLELDRHADPISGRLVAGDGAGEEFVGWLGLSAVLERLTTEEENESTRDGMQ